MEKRKVEMFTPGEYIFKEGQKGDVMYILLEGTVELRKKVEGGEKCLKIVDKRNDFFGEMALVDQSPRSASAVAATETKLVAVDQPTFEKMILTNGKFALKVIKILSARIRNSNVQISELITEVPKERCIRGMVDYAVSHGERIFNGGMKIDIEEMRDWLNHHIGVSVKEVDACLFKLLKRKEVNYAAATGGQRKEIVLSETFINLYNRRQTK